MIEFESPLENFLNNLELHDINGLDSVVMNKSLIYNGSVGNIVSKKYERNYCRVPPLYTAVIGLNNTAAYLPNELAPQLWTDFDVQDRYLNGKPACYLILGKPGAGAYLLGEAISKKLNCIHICPRNVLVDEINQESDTGKCISFNLKQQKDIQFDVILSIIKAKVDSPAVKHRGYVISGLPMVTSDLNSFYQSSVLYPEDALQTVENLMFETLVELKKKRIKTSSSSLISTANEEEIEDEHQEENIEEEEEQQPIELPKFLLDRCSGIIIALKKYMTTKKVVLLKQLHTILNMSFKPDIIIYLTCPDKDLIMKKKCKYYNYFTKSYTSDRLPSNLEREHRWPTKYEMSDYISPHESIHFDPKYNCRHPINFDKNSFNQLCHYKQHILPFVKELLNDFNPKHVIKLDARHSVGKIIHNFNEKISFLPNEPIIIPEPLYINELLHETNDFWKSLEELNVLKSGKLNFYRYPSLWYNRCPVELKKRRSLKGQTKYAVSFFKHVYLLSSLNNMISFCRNPRPYLQMKFLEPTCRIFVMGTKSSGKTMISNCLSWLFDTPVLCYELFTENQKKKKHAAFSKSILSEIIAPLEDTRFSKWQLEEKERIQKLNNWLLNIRTSLQKYISIFLELSKVEDNLEPDISMFEEYNNLRAYLSFLPFLEDLDECTKIANFDNNHLLKFAPIELTTVTKSPSIPAIGDQDVTEAISNYILTNDLQKEIEPTKYELLNEFGAALNKIDNESQQLDGSYGKYIVDGFPSDVEFWNYLSDCNLLPDNTISLIETREVDFYIFQIYKASQNSLKNYQERYGLADDPLIKTKLLHKNLPNSTVIDVQIIIQEYMTKVFSYIFTEEVPSDQIDTNNEISVITAFTTLIEQYREDWDSVKLKLEDNYKSFIEVELANKSDIEIIEEVLLKLRKSYNLTCEVNENGEIDRRNDENEEFPKNLATYNVPHDLSESSIYCPITYYKYRVLWEGKPELSIKYNNKVHFFSNEDCFELFQKDVTRYQQLNKPFKPLPPLRLCVIGCIGTGKSTLSKLIAKELGLIYLDINQVINNYLIPRHFKRVGRQFENCFIDTLIDEEDVTDLRNAEEDENLIADILGNEKELRSMVYNYFERGLPILSNLMLKILKKLWFSKPFSETGFVLDGYPRLPADVEDMVAGYCIPDLIIELEGSVDTTFERISENMYKTWENQLMEAKNVAGLKLENEKLLWINFVTKTVVVKLIVEDILDVIFHSTDEPQYRMSATSMKIEPDFLDGVADIRLTEFYNDMIQEYPPPTDHYVWEKPDEARERINARIEVIFEIEDEGIQSLKEVLLEQKIQFVSVDCTKPLNKVYRATLLNLSNLRNRSDSFFEQTYYVSCDIAEILLLQGFYFLSKFKRLCPVYIYEKPYTIINPYKMMERNSNIFPVIHRSYIYFTFTKENLMKFRLNPLKYITSDNINTFVEYPLTISVIGPPKSGKSVLAHKLAKHYGLMCISKGSAIRYTLEQLHWTELAIQMKKNLSEGKTLSNNESIYTIQNIAVHYNIVTSGFVFDGFPESAAEARELLSNGIYPTFIIDILTAKCNILENSQRELYYDIIKTIPPYSAPLIEYKYNKWQSNMNQFRDWIKNDIQNLYIVTGEKSKWLCCHETITCIENELPKIHNYLTNVSKKVVSANCMCISNDIFSKRMSSFKNLCPICLSNNILRHSGHPVDKKGIVEFENKFYWVCADHIDLFMKFPKRFLSITNVDVQELPVIVKTINTSKVYESGICIVTYANNLPSQKIVRARRVPVPDERFNYLCEYHKPASKVPAFLNVVDIAGLVRGAAEGQGLGNAFLSHIKACDAVFNLCRAFDDEDVIHVDGDVNPVRDLETIGEELRLKDEEQLMQNIEKLDRVVNRGNDKKLKPEYDALLKIKTTLVDEKKHIRFGDWSAAEIEVLNKYLFLTSKPALYLVNLSEKDYIRKKNKWLPKLKEWIDKNDPGAPLIPFSGVLETKLMDMDAEEKKAFFKEHNITSALDKIIVQGYKALQLEYFFTAGADEVKAWTIQKGTKAPQAAGRIHTDFEKGFIMAEVMHYKDFKEEGSEAACKSAGKYRQQGRNYVVEDGDIIFFKFNAGAGLKDAKKK